MGQIQLADGSTREGLVALASNQDDVAGLRYFDSIYYARDESSPVEVYFAPAHRRPGIQSIMEATQTIEGAEVGYKLFRGSLIDQNSWIAKIENDKRRMRVEDLLPGELEFKNGIILRGEFAFQRGRKKTFAYMIDEEGDLLYISSDSEEIKALKVTSDGEEKLLVVLDAEFVNNREVIEDFQKKKSLYPGRVVLVNGDILEGRVSLRRLSNVLRSYRTPNGAYFVADDEKQPVSLYTPDDIDYVEIQEDGVLNNYVPLDRGLVIYEDFLNDLESMNSRDETNNLQSGYIAFNDGSKLTGRIAQLNSSAIFVGENRNFEKYNAYDSSLSYFVQRINQQERKFMPMKHGVRAFSGEGMEFVEILYANAKFSYYPNPDPTHIRGFMTALAKGAVNAASSVGRMALANAAAKEQIKQSMENSNGDFTSLTSAVVQGAGAQAQTLELTEGIVQVDPEGGLYHKEWIIENNISGEKVAVFSGNAEEELDRILRTCSTFSSLDNREARQLTNINSLDAAVRYLNSC